MGMDIGYGRQKKRGEAKVMNEWTGDNETIKTLLQLR